MEEELIILASYINISGLSRVQAQEMIYNVIESHKDMYDDVLTKKVKVYYVPITNGDSRIECIYPVGKTISEAESKIINLYKTMLNSSDEQIKEIFEEFEIKMNLLKIKENK